MASFQIPSLGPFMRVGIVGCGRVGRTIVFAIDTGRVRADLAAVCDTNADRVQDLIFQLKRPTRSMSLHGLVASVDFVVEATNRHVAPAIIMAALDGGKDILVTNTAAILARDDFGRIALDRGLTIFAANSLLTGANALNAAPVAAANVTLTITCPPLVLEDAPFLRGRELKAGDEPQMVFQGEGADALAAFPALANVIAAAMIGAGGAGLLVRVQAHQNAHATDIELEVVTEKQRTHERVQVAAAGREPVDPESIGMLAVGFLRSLVASIRLV